MSALRLQGGDAVPTLKLVTRWPGLPLESAILMLKEPTGRPRRRVFAAVKGIQ